MRRAPAVALAWAVLLGFPTGAARAQVPVPATAPAPPDTAAATRPDTTAAARADTTAVPAPRVLGPALAPPTFALAPRATYLLRRSVSLDHYLEWEPGFVLVRDGPIGHEAAVSRWGMGRGRATVLLDGVPLNDPASGVAPLVPLPASGMGVVHTGGDVDRAVIEPAPTEGLVAIDLVSPPAQRPAVYLDLSRGDRQLRQRRVRFSSAQGPVGIDLGYDEVLDNGYSFDAAGNVGLGVPGFGEGESRSQSLRVRGIHPGGETYALGFRRFDGTWNGDLQSEFHEYRRSGYLATASSSFGRLGVVLFERGYDTTAPDSQVVDRTTAGYASFHVVRREDASLVVKAGVEDVTARQSAAGARGRSSLTKGAVSVTGTVRLPGRVTARAWGAGADYRKVVGAWGGGARVERAWGRVRVDAGFRRAFRLPALDELYTPAHARGATTIAGNAALDAETTHEVDGGLTVSIGPLVNAVRATSLRVGDPILPVARTVAGATWIVPDNGDALRLHVLEERLRWSRSLRGFLLSLEGGATVTGGDRSGWFAAVPKTTSFAAIRMGGEMFERTSALYLSARYRYSSERSDYDGRLLPSYGVADIILDGRLLDANMYLAMLNVSDEHYRTEGDYLMTPRTFMYGISWTLLD